MWYAGTARIRHLWPIMKEECWRMQDWCAVRGGGLLSLGFPHPAPFPGGSFRTHLPGWTIHLPSNVNLCFSVAEVVSSLASGLCWHPSEQSRMEQARIFFTLSIVAKGRAYYAQNPLKVLGVILLKSWMAEKVFITTVLYSNLFFKDIFKEQFTF